MSSDEKFSIDDISSMFHTESEKLENLINNATTKSELPIPEIIETYYQITNCLAMRGLCFFFIESAGDDAAVDGRP